jgi:hypothetical protein
MRGTGSGASPSPLVSDFVVDLPTSGGINVLTPDDHQAGIRMGSPSDITGVVIGWKFDDGLMQIGTTRAGAGIQFVTGGGVEAGRWSANGDLGIGTAAPSRRLSIADTATAGSVLRIANSVGQCDFTPVASGEPGMSCSSDARLKANVRPLSTREALEDLARVPLFEYELLASPETTVRGPVAQELAKTRPELVSEAEDGMLMAQLPSRTELIGAIQELQKVVVALQARVAVLEAERHSSNQRR